MEYTKGWSTLENIVTLYTHHRSHVGILEMHPTNRENQRYFGERVSLRVLFPVRMHSFYPSEMYFEI